MAGSVPNDQGGAPAQSAAPLRVLMDTNVVLDVLLAREPWAAQAKPILDAHDAGRVTLYLSAAVLTDIYYISRKQVGVDRAKAGASECLQRYDILSVDAALLLAALNMSGPDFEDNVQIAIAHAAGLDFFVTRNPTDYIGSPISAIEPQALATRLSSP